MTKWFDKLAHSQVSRRDFLKGSAAATAAVAGLSLAGCGNNVVDTTTEAPKETTKAPVETTAPGIEYSPIVDPEEGGKWVAIDGNTMNYAPLASSDAYYTGALVSEGIIYATDNTHYYAIDPSGNAYTVTKGDNFTDGDGAPFMHMLDGTAAPVQTVKLTD